MQFHQRAEFNSGRRNAFARAWMSRKYDALFVACCNLLERIREVSQIRLGIDILLSMATDDEKFADL
jgi:hypothetical protein